VEAESVVPFLLTNIGVRAFEEKISETLYCLLPYSMKGLLQLIQPSGVTTMPVRLAAARILTRAEIYHERTLPVFVDALRSSDLRLRIKAIESLGALGPAATSAVPALKSIRKEADKEVLSAVEIALQKISPRPLDDVNLTALACCNSRFVAMGNDHTRGRAHIAVSGDGIRWNISAPEALATFHPRELKCRPDRAFLALGYGNSLAVSLDGLTWEVRHPRIPLNASSIAYGNGRLVAISEDYSEAGTVATSGDGDTWEIVKPKYSWTMSSLLFAGGLFVAADSGLSRMHWSADGIAWSHEQGTSFVISKIFGVTHGDRGFVAVGRQGRALYSRDGRDWREAQVGSASLYAVAYGGGMYVAVGEVREDGRAQILTSSDGEEWSSRDSGMTHDLKAVAYGSNIFVAIGKSVILMSRNGITWQEPTQVGAP
jgi:hypothetical protein